MRLCDSARLGWATVRRSCASVSTTNKSFHNTSQYCTTYTNSSLHRLQGLHTDVDGQVGYPTDWSVVRSRLLWLPIPDHVLKLFAAPGGVDAPCGLHYCVAGAAGAVSDKCLHIAHVTQTNSEDISDQPHPTPGLTRVSISTCPAPSKIS